MRKKIFLVIAGIIAAIVIGKAIADAIRLTPIVFELLFNKEISLVKKDERVNMLFMGTGGEKHEGPDLTDTIMFVSVNPKDNRITIVSIPRDLWIPEISAKINTAYAKGNLRQKAGGINLTKAIVSKLLNQRIDYVVVVDFEGFVKAVDLMGGLDISVDRAFDDFEYPVEEKKDDLCQHTLDEATALIATQSPLMVFPCRYQHIHFDEGLQHLSGERALVFVRSRYAQGTEGTDFARNIRQQKVIKAFKDKVFSAQTFLNPIKIANLYSVLSESIDTNVSPWEFDDFIKLAQKMKTTEIHSTVIEEQDEEKKKSGLLINPPLTDFNGSWVLIPRIGKGKYAEIQQHVSCVLVSNNCPISQL